MSFPFFAVIKPLIFEMGSLSKSALSIFERKVKSMFFGISKASFSLLAAVVEFTGLPESACISADFLLLATGFFLLFANVKFRSNLHTTKPIVNRLAMCRL